MLKESEIFRLKEKIMHGMGCFMKKIIYFCARK